MRKGFELAVIALFLIAPAAFAHTQEEPLQVPLLAGKSIDAGTVAVWNDAENLYVKYEASNGFVLSETHLAIALTLDAIPQTKTGNPKVGNFQYGNEFATPVNEYTYTINLQEAGYAIGTELYIAAHAVVSKDVFENGKSSEQETAWASGLQFPGRNWATYFQYIIQPPVKELRLPPVTINSVFYVSSSSYFDTVLGNIAEGYDVSNGTFVGWCADLLHFIYPGQTYEVKLYSSYDPALPSYAQDADWDMVNYILNHKHPDATKDDVQEAIWFFVGGGAYPTDLEAIAMVEDALANGEGFVPVHGQNIAIVVDAGPDVQLTFIEIDP